VESTIQHQAFTSTRKLKQAEAIYCLQITNSYNRDQGCFDRQARLSDAVEVPVFVEFGQSVLVVITSFIKGSCQDLELASVSFFH
jgi:hypothetical protein